MPNKIIFFFDPNPLLTKGLSDQVYETQKKLFDLPFQEKIADANSHEDGV
jgi:hypothetical protein